MRSNEPALVRFTAMDPSHEPQETFDAEYAPMSDKELLDVAADYADLVDPARAAMRDELKRRGLELPKPPEEPEEPAPTLPTKLPWKLSELTNSHLLELAADYDKFSEPDQASMRAEFASRGLEPPLVEDNNAQPEAIAQNDALLNDPVSDFITIRTFRDLSAAYVARAYLEASGIPCILRDENTIRTDWFLSNALGGAKLQVPSSYAQEADEKLSLPIPASFEDGTGQEYAQPVCPKCGSLDVMEDDTDRKIKTSSIVMFPLATPALSALPFTAKGDWKCLQCGCRWIDNGEPDPADIAPLR